MDDWGWELQPASGSDHPGPGHRGVAERVARASSALAPLPVLLLVGPCARLPLPSAERTRVRSSGPGWAACRREPRRASPSRSRSQQAPRRRTPRDRHAIAKVPLSA